MSKCLIFIWILIANTTTAQIRSASDKLELKIMNFFASNSDYSRAERLRQKPTPSESIIIQLELDSTGRVENVRLMVDDNTKDSGYAILKKLNPSYFSDWQNENYKRKTIVIPVIVANDESAIKLFHHLVDLTGKPRQFNDLVVERGLVLWWPEIKE